MFASHCECNKVYDRIYNQQLSIVPIHQKQKQKTTEYSTLLSAVTPNAMVQ